MSDALSAMLGRESAYSVRDYLRADPNSRGLVHGEALSGEGRDDASIVTVHPPTITAGDRLKLVDWCYDVVDRCQLQRETVAIAMNVVDRFMSVVPPSSLYMRERDEYQLLTVASLYIAVKVAEHSPFSSEAMSAISHGTYSAEEVEAVEIEILTALGWRLNPPTPAAVGRQILEILGRSTSSRPSRAALGILHGELAYQTELAVRELHFSTERPGIIAVASLMNAVARIVDDLDREILTRGLLRVVMELRSQFSFDNPRILVEARQRLAALVDENDEDDGTDIPDEGAVVAIAQ